MYRKENKVSLRDFAKETGLQFHAINRLEKGGEMNSRNLGLLFCWLFETPKTGKAKR